FQGKPARHGLGVLRRDGNDLVYCIGLPQRWDKTDADPLDLVRSARSSGQDRRLRRFHGGDMQVGLVLAQATCGAEDRVPGTDRVDKGIDSAAGLSPDLLAHGEVAVNGVAVAQLITPPVPRLRGELVR